MKNKQISKRKKLFKNQHKVPTFKSQRFCFICKKITKFELNKTIGHSECIECGSRASMKLDNPFYKIFEETKTELEKEISDLKKQAKDGKTIINFKKSIKSKDKTYSRLKLKYDKLKRER